VSIAAGGRPGAMPDPPSMTTADSVYRLTTQFSRVGTVLEVKNPLTGVDIDNIAAIDGSVIVKIGKIT